MAHLGEPIYPDVEWVWNEVCGMGWWQSKDIRDEYRWLEEQVANQPSDGIKGRYISFPVADGKAVYYVEKLRPLTLRPVMFGDCYQIPDAHIRGLTRSDIEEMVEREKRIQEIFSRKA